ncbi:MAG: EamA family transporter, partial [Candidatus Micrarchaeales archaeon]
MGFGIGVAFAIGALFFWGIGDFLIQKTTRHIGDWETILFIVAFGAIILIPFIYKDLVSYLYSPQALLTMFSVSVVIFLAALIDFEALKRGKIAAVEPALSLEIPTVAIISIIVINETPQLLELIFLILLM